MQNAILLQRMQTSLQEAINSMRYGENPVELYEPIRYLMQLGGKRLRPVLTLMGYRLWQPDYTQAIKPALAVEVFHNFTLMHDDIMDKAPLRRGKPTVHEKWNANIAILSGDVMLVKAYELMLEVPLQYLPEALRLFNQCAAEVCEGQQLDMNFERIDSVTQEQYLEMIRLKTSVLLGFALQLGALIAGASLHNQEKLRDFGTLMGIGFQLTDDLLDVYGESEKFGKQVGGDIIANKKTFLLIEALLHAQGREKEELDNWLNATTFDKDEKVKAITEVYNKLNIRQLTEKVIQQYFDEGLKALAEVEASEEQKAPLYLFADMLMQRES